MKQDRWKKWKLDGSIPERIGSAVVIISGFIIGLYIGRLILAL